MLAKRRDLPRQDLISTGGISGELGMTINSKALAEIGCTPDFQTNNGSFWYKDRMPEICFAAIRHLTLKGETYASQLNDEHNKGK